MKGIIIAVLLFVFSLKSWSQTDSLLTMLQDSTKETVKLLPSKMIFTQRILWGQKGLFRQFGWAPLTPVHREKELKLRRKILIIHQASGLLTLGGFVAQGIVGYKLYNGRKDLKDTHESIAGVINTTYTVTMLMALTAPPPMLNRDKKLSSIRLHKWLAAVHITGMIATNILAGQAEDNPNMRKYHKAAAIATFASFAAAIIVIKI